MWCVVCVCVYVVCVCVCVAANESADIETLVDDFVTFYVAGKQVMTLLTYIRHTIYYPGQETTANTLSFAVILVHQHPEVLERLLAEIDEVLGSRTSVTAEDLEKLQYTEQVRGGRWILPPV